MDTTAIPAAPATVSDILASKCWSSNRPVNTSQGPRLLRTMPAQGWHYHVRQSDPSAFRRAGLSFGKDLKGRDTVCHWQENKPAEILEKASRATEAACHIPAPVGCDYLPFQKAGIQYAVSAANCIIGDEMGLGKTVQALGVLNVEKWQRALIVCPATLKLNWKREAEKWLTTPDDILTGINIISAGDSYERPKLRDDRELVIINYDLLHKHEAILRNRWDILICDEAHYLKNKDAKRTKAALNIESGKFLALTGTPILNKPVELWTLASRCAPAAFPNYWGYVKRYCGAENNGWGWDVSGATNLGELQQKLRQHCLVRRLKSEVLKELPAKRRQIIELPPTKEMKLVMDAENKAWGLHEDTIASLCERRDRAAINDDDTTYREAAAALKGAWKTAFAEMAIVRKQTALAKLPLCIQHIKDVLGGGVEKVVIFAHHKDVISNLMAELSDFQPVVISGEVDNDDRQAAVDRFQNDPECRVFVGSIRAAGMGVTLTASSHVMFVEEDWTPAMISQAEDRCHRIGQLNSVLVQHLLLEGSLDCNMIRRCIEKQEVSELALDRQPAEPVAEPVAPVAPRGPSKFSARGAAMDMCQRESIHEAIKIIAGLDSDKARARNGAGFSKFDSAIGHELAHTAELSDGQAGYGWQLARKYRRQLPTKIINLCKFDEV